jgi:hypothetical protein
MAEIHAIIDGKSFSAPDQLDSGGGLYTIARTEVGGGCLLACGYFPRVRPTTKSPEHDNSKEDSLPTVILQSYFEVCNYLLKARPVRKWAAVIEKAIA